MTRPRYPSDDLRAKIKPHFRVHLSAANHPKTVATYADNDLFAAWVRLGMLGVERGAAHTGDRIHMSRFDVVRVSGRHRFDSALILVRCLADMLGWSIEYRGDITVIQFRNLGTKQGFTPRLRAEAPRTPQDSACSPPPVPSPLSPSLRARSATGSDPIKTVYDRGVALLTSRGITESNARSFLGRLRKRHKDDDDKVLGLLDRAGSQVDPVAWLAKTMQDPSKREYVPGGYRE